MNFGPENATDKSSIDANAVQPFQDGLDERGKSFCWLFQEPLDKIHKERCHQNSEN